MNDRRDEVLAFIKDYYEKVGIPPTRREIAQACGVNVTSAQWHVEHLIRDGYLRRIPGVPRAIVPTDNMKHPEAGL